MDATIALIALVILTTCLVAGGVLATRKQAAALQTLSAEIEATLPAPRRGVRTGSALEQLAQSVAAARDLIAEVGHRAPQRNPVTGVETRESLMAKIASSGHGLLGVVDLTDFDALSARDVDTADAVLKTFAQRIVRMTGRDRGIAQIDRARFAVWFESVDTGDARAEFEALAYALRDRIDLPGFELLPKVAVGIAIRANGSETGRTLLARTISDLGDRSAFGDDRATPAPAVEARKRVTLEHDLRQAVARQQFALLYQPFVDAEQNTVCGAEALLRWTHPEHGKVSPGEFMPLVERTGLAEEVGLWVLDTAIAQAACWQARTGLDVRVAANLSANQLSRPDLDRVVDRMLVRHALPSALLELELTETAAALDSAAVATLFERLRSRGVSISIDDFGAGYSSLSYLRRLKFDKLKIDREFVTQVDSDRQNQAICQSIIALGRGLGIAVLAEGVERPEEYRWLRRHGCRYFQGYYFARPLEADAFVAFAKDRQALAMHLDCGPASLQKKIGVLAA